MSRKRFNELIRLPEFERDIRKLAKKFRTIEGDLDVFIGTGLYLFHKLNMDNKGIFRIMGLPFDNPAVYKAKKFACRSLKGKGVHSGIRVIYAYYGEKDRIELVEIYYKGDKENEDRGRITRLI
jgi:mRNA-degrading endonuclease RelE of RelBE toxin-antitoxin system